MGRCEFATKEELNVSPLIPVAYPNRPFAEPPVPVGSVSEK